MYKRNAPYLARQEMGIMELDTNFLSDRDAVLSLEKELCAAISVDRNLRDQQAP